MVIADPDYVVLKQIVYRPISKIDKNLCLILLSAEVKMPPEDCI